MQRLPSFTIAARGCGIRSTDMGLFSAIFAPGEQKRGEELDAQLADLNRQRLESGYYTQEIYDQAEANRISGVVDVDAQIGGAFKEGAAEGAANVKETIGNGISSAVKGIASVLPWQVWVLGALVAAVYFWPVLAPALRARK